MSQSVVDALRERALRVDSPLRAADIGAKISAGKKGKPVERLRDENHHYWKGDEAGYVAFHNWVRRRKAKTGICEWCREKPETRTEWANLSGDYRRDLDDYAELCGSCHKKFDHARKRLGFTLNV